MNTKQEEALREYLKEAITPLIEQVLVKKLGQAMSFAASELVQPQRTWVGLEKSDMPDGADPLFDDPKFIAGMVYAANKLMEKNT